MPNSTATTNDPPSATPAMDAFDARNLARPAPILLWYYVIISWGILFRREIQLTYRRIQDIHVTRNILHRWMGLANVAIQTASGSAGAEMIIEGVLEADALRDFLYKKMRGARGDDEQTGDVPSDAVGAPDDEALVLLRQIRDEIRALSSARNRDTGGANEPSS